MIAALRLAWLIFSMADRPAQVAVVVGPIGIVLAFVGLSLSRKTIADAIRIDEGLARADREARQFEAFKRPTLSTPAPKAFSKYPLPSNPNHEMRAIARTERL